MLDALSAVAANNAPERILALADSILEREPHLVGLQEMFRFNCEESGTLPGACLLFDAAMNDHLQLTLDALGSTYYVAGIVNDLTIPDADFSLPGLPVFLDADAIPEVFIQVLDRDVILARSDVPTSIVPYPCELLGLHASEDGCNFNEIATADALGETLKIQRGFVGVDATVNGGEYRVVNTHLEVQYPAPLQDAPLIQAAQASELIAAQSLFQPPAGTTLMIVGDINSNPLAPVFETSFGWMAFPPYKQLRMGVSIWGDPISLPYTDIWPFRPGKSPGLTCCQAADLSNRASNHYERIDVIFTLQPPARVKANVLDDSPEDKTPSGLWPSDHASMVGRLFYRSDERGKGQPVRARFSRD
jgi:endonuclease/exonuclease/phosphatase family metal-dependent hydrolase